MHIRSVASLLWQWYGHAWYEVKLDQGLGSDAELLRRYPYCAERGCVDGNNRPRRLRPRACLLWPRVRQQALEEDLVVGASCFMLHA